VSERRDDDAGHADTIASDGDAAAATTDAGPAAPTPIGPGSELGRYLLGAELGSGGMATVYRARDRELRRDVAVKVLFPHLAKKAELTGGSSARPGPRPASSTRASCGSTTSASARRRTS
jgi:serine/threonine protein kinase